MEYRSLGRTGVQVSALCLGCMNFGGRADEKTAVSIIDAALDAGINFVDTADVYGHDPADFSSGRGRSEEIIGRALGRSQRRDRVVLATKLHFPMSDDPNMRGSSRRHVIAACEASLRRLQTDFIDLYQLHHPSNVVPIDETLRALDDLVRAGKVRYIGSSSFGAWQIVESLWAASDLHLNRFISEQPAYNLLDRRVERELVPMAQTYGIAILPWSPTAGGFLSGAYRHGEPPAQESRFGAFWKAAQAQHFTDGAFAVVDVVNALATEKQCTPYQIALAWCARQPGVTSAIFGPRRQDHVAEAVGALAITFSADDMTRIDAVSPPGDKVVPYYGHDGMAWVTWGPHTQRWR